MGIIAWIVLGAIVGIIAEKLTGQRLGLLVGTVVGILGALLGGWLAKALFHIQTLDTFFDLSTWVTAIIGAVVLLLVVGALSGRGGRRSHFGSRRRRTRRGRAWI
jgi:uncharacterized membrane protein YeaQ/YmgE (transglycosylase-associated protein family)